MRMDTLICRQISMGPKYTYCPWLGEDYACFPLFILNSATQAGSYALSHTPKLIYLVLVAEQTSFFRGWGGHIIYIICSQQRDSRGCSPLWKKLPGTTPGMHLSTGMYDYFLKYNSRRGWWYPNKYFLNFDSQTALQKGCTNLYKTAFLLNLN